MGEVHNIRPSGRMEPVITVSASYGSGGSVIAPALAARLAVPLIDRLLTADVSESGAREACEPSGESIGESERTVTPGSRLFRALAGVAMPGAVALPPADLMEDEELRKSASAGLTALTDGGPGVVLGRAGAVLLADRPRTLHVRLDGPADRRIKRGAEIEGISEKRSSERLTSTDRARELWVKRLFKADVTDPKWYHLQLDTTVIRTEDAMDIIVLNLECLLGAHS